MCIWHVVVLLLGAFTSAAEDGAPCDGEGLCNGARRFGSNLLQHRSSRSSLEALTDRELARQRTVVSSEECIDRCYAPIMKEAGWHDADLLLKDSVAEAMTELVRKRDDPLTVDEAADYMWRSYHEWYCAVANGGCTIQGQTFADVRQEFLNDRFQVELAQSEARDGAHPRVDQGNARRTRASCQSTRAESTQEVERAHAMPPGDLAALAMDLLALQEQGVGKSQILRMVAAQVMQEARSLGLLRASSIGSPVAVALSHVLLSQHELLLALGEPAKLARDESLHASAAILLDEGSCLDTTESSSPGMSLHQAVGSLVKPYMEMHCAVNPDCHSTYTKIVSGGEARDASSSGLVQAAMGVVKQGGRTMLKGVAATMRLLGVRTFDAEVFEARANATSNFAIAVRVDDRDHFAAIAQLLQHERVRGAGHVILLTADMLRCH